jgi:hypothetical protein
MNGPKMKPKTTVARPDTTLQALKNMHERAKYQKSIGIPEGKRLKLDSVKPTFADLSGDPSATQCDPEVDGDDNEDWPNVHDLLNAPKAPGATIERSSSASDNSNPEIKAELPDDSRRSDYRLATPPPSRKRPREPENAPPSNQVNQVDASADAIPERFISSPPVSQPNKVHIFQLRLYLLTHSFAEKAKQGASSSCGSL